VVALYEIINEVVAGVIHFFGLSDAVGQDSDAAVLVMPKFW